MIISKSYKTELAPTKKQKELFLKCFGVSRFVYNWGLENRINHYKETEKSVSFFEQNNYFNSIKKEQFPWISEVSKCIAAEALSDLDKAYNLFFKALKKKSKRKVGFPKFKSKHKSKNSFRLTSTIKVTEDYIYLPKKMKIKFKEKGYLPSESEKVHILSATVSEHCGRWFVSINVKEEIEVSQSTGDVIGIDLGLKTLAVTSDGIEFENPRTLYKSQKKLVREQRALARKQKGSNNRKKAILRLQRVYYKVSNIRKDMLHKYASLIVSRTKCNKDRPSVIVLEDLNISGMMKNHNRARSLSDVGLAEFRRQIEYKSSWAGIQVIIVDRWFPSSKLCNVCGSINEELTLKDRFWTCSVCGTFHDRDLNAAINLRNYGIRVLSTDGLSGTGSIFVDSNACGDGVRLSLLSSRRGSKKKMLDEVSYAIVV